MVLQVGSAVQVNQSLMNYLCEIISKFTIVISTVVSSSRSSYYHGTLGRISVMTVKSWVRFTIVAAEDEG